MKTMTITASLNPERCSCGRDLAYNTVTLQPGDRRFRECNECLVTDARDFRKQGYQIVDQRHASAKEEPTVTTKTDEKGVQRTPKPAGLRIGTKLRSVSYHGKTFEAEIVANDDGRHLVKVGGKTYRSLSSAGSACMGGIACRGGTFWKIFERPEYRQAEAPASEKPKAAKAKVRKRAAGKK